MRAQIEAQLNQARGALDLKPNEVDLTKVTPIFAQAWFAGDGRWFGPWVKLRNPEIVMMWAVMLRDFGVRYVDHGMTKHWEENGVDWRAIALENLAGHSSPETGSHHMTRPSGEVFALAFMHADGIGPSRLLFRDRLEAIFPHGYRVAIPERSCAVALEADLEGPDLADIEGVIAKCFRKGTSPVSPRIYHPDELLPEE